MFNNLYMRSVSDERKAWAIIRDTAMGLFAEHGPSEVTIRDIAAAAKVSPALVIHHFGSKEGLRDAIDRHVAGFVEALMSELARFPADMDEGSLVRSFSTQLEQQPALAGYVRRMFIDDGPAGDALFDRLFAATTAGIERLVAQGLVRPAQDEPTRAAFLLVNDLGAMLLRRQIHRVLGTDPFTGPGLERWTVELMDIYVNGMFARDLEPGE
jgi:AcrR family transcriptional regulator